MFGKIRERVLKIQWNYYHRLGDYCFRKVNEYGPENNTYWVKLTEKYTVKEFEVIDKLYR